MATIVLTPSGQSTRPYTRLAHYLQLLHTGHQGRVHAAELGAPLVERGVADAVFAAQLRDRAAGFGLLENGDDLAVGKAGCLHVEFSSVLSRKFYF